MNSQKKKNENFTFSSHTHIDFFHSNDFLLHQNIVLHEHWEGCIQCSSPLLKNALLLQMHYYFREINEMH